MGQQALVREGHELEVACTLELDQQVSSPNLQMIAQRQKIVGLNAHEKGTLSLSQDPPLHLRRSRTHSYSWRRNRRHSADTSTGSRDRPKPIRRTGTAVAFRRDEGHNAGKLGGGEMTRG